MASLVRSRQGQGATSGPTSLVITVDATGHSAGNHLILKTYNRNPGTTRTITSIVDSKNGAWNIDRAGQSTTTGQSISSVYLALALVAGDTITITWDGAISALPVWHLNEWNGLLTSGWKDIDAGTANSGASPVNMAAVTPSAGDRLIESAGCDEATIGVTGVGGNIGTWVQAGTREVASGPTGLVSLYSIALGVNGSTSYQGNISYNISLPSGGARSQTVAYKIVAGVYTDSGTAAISMTPSGVEVGANVDSATVRLSLTPDVVEQFDHPSFPTVGVLDTCVRANENPLSGSGNWALVATGIPQMQLTSNKVTSSSSSAGAQSYWNHIMTGSDVESFITVDTLPADNKFIARLQGRMAGLGGATSLLSGYRLMVTYHAAAGDTWTIERIDAGAATVLQTVTQDVAAGEKIGLSIIGNVIKGYLFSGGTWTEIISITDTTYNRTGYLSIGAGDNVARLSSFGGGVSSPTMGFVDANTVNFVLGPSAIEGQGFTYSMSVLNGRFEMCGNLIISYQLNPPPPTPIPPGVGGIIPPPIISPPAPFRVVHLRHDGQQLGEVFPTNPQFQIALNKVNSITYDIDISDGLASRQNTEPYGTDFDFYRGDKILMSGMHTNLGLSQIEDHTLQITGQSWEHYLEQEWPFDPDNPLAAVYTAFQKDMFEVVEYMLAVMTALPNSLPLTFNNGNSGHLINFKIDVADTEHVLDKITTLSQNQVGFDFEITPDKIVRLYTPRRGQKRAFVLQQGVNIYEFDYMNNGIVGTHTVGYAQMSSSRAGKVVDADTQTKYRRWAVSHEFSDIGDDPAFLQTLTQAESDRNGTPAIEFTCKVIPEYVSDIFEQISIGDIVHVYADIGWDIVDEDMRIVSIAGAPNDEGDEEITLGLDDATLSL